MVGKVFNAEKSERAIWQYLHADSNNAQGQAAKEGNLKGRLVFEKQDGEEFLAFKYMPNTIRTWLSLPGFHEIVDLCDQNHIVVQGLARKIEQLNRQSCFGRISTDVILRIKEREKLQAFQELVANILEGRSFSSLYGFDLQDPLFKDELQKKARLMLMAHACSNIREEYPAARLVPFCTLKDFEAKAKSGKALIELICQNNWLSVLEALKEKCKNDGTMDELRKLLDKEFHSAVEYALDSRRAALAYLLIVDIGFPATQAQIKKLIGYFKEERELCRKQHKPDVSLEELLKSDPREAEPRRKISYLNNLLSPT